MTDRVDIAASSGRGRIQTGKVQLTVDNDAKVPRRLNDLDAWRQDQNITNVDLVDLLTCWRIRNLVTESDLDNVYDTVITWEYSNNV